MRLTVTALFMTVFVAGPGSHDARGQRDDRAVLEFARGISIRALTFRQQDGDAFAAVRAQFTADGWTQFMSTMRGWLDRDGSPSFSSAFVPSGDGRIVDERNGLVHVRIPGSLTQMQNQSRTTYSRFAVDIWVLASAMAVERLTQTTCLGASNACE